MHCARKPRPVTITDVMCNLCFRTFLVGVAIELRPGNGHRSHVCQECSDLVLEKLGINGAEREKVKLSWQR